MNLGDEIDAVKALFERYANVPSSLADACLIRLAEQHERCRVMTL
ncbi:MAG: pilus assembly protein, partial [Phyllobacteriaceae bacterium]|nr:pilus assembly protein [Phyllobacteriaceae bacterium]